MNMEILNKLKLLKDKIDYHNFRYHTKDDPEISDFQFDELCKQYDNIISVSYTHLTLPTKA